MMLGAHAPFGGPLYSGTRLVRSLDRDMHLVAQLVADRMANNVRNHRPLMPSVQELGGLIRTGTFEWRIPLRWAQDLATQCQQKLEDMPSRLPLPKYPQPKPTKDMPAWLHVRFGTSLPDDEWTFRRERWYLTPKLHMTPEVIETLVRTCVDRGISGAIKFRDPQHMARKWGQRSHPVAMGHLNVVGYLDKDRHDDIVDALQVLNRRLGRDAFQAGPYGVLFTLPVPGIPWVGYTTGSRRSVHRTVASLYLAALQVHCAGLIRKSQGGKLPPDELVDHIYTQVVQRGLAPWRQVLQKLAHDYGIVTCADFHGNSGLI